MGRSAGDALAAGPWAGPRSQGQRRQMPGDGLSYLWAAPFGQGNPEWSGLVSYVRWDWISTSYMMASVVALVACYVFAFGSGKSDVIGNGTIALQSTMTIARIWRG
jgi:hypothetical protein